MGLKFTARKTKAQNNHKNKKGNGRKKTNKNKGQQPLDRQALRQDLVQHHSVLLIRARTKSPFCTDFLIDYPMVIGHKSGLLKCCGYMERLNARDR